jgi:pyrroloquinoline-quinone synthase
VFTVAATSVRVLTQKGKASDQSEPGGMETLPMTSFHDDVRRIVADRHLLTHPFYVAWSSGELTTDQLRGYAGQYMHHVLAEPTYLSAVHANTPHFASDGSSDLSTRQAILQNLVDEELGPRNHPALWKQFAASLGLSEVQLAAAAPLPATRRLIETFTNICRNRPYYAGLAALHAFESQVPDIAAVKIDGLRHFYGFEDPAGYEFFTVHKDADVVHSATEWELIERAADTPAKRAEVLAATQEACDALWAFLGDVYATPA